jgi:hypothetical protein
MVMSHVRSLARYRLAPLVLWGAAACADSGGRYPSKNLCSTCAGGETADFPGASYDDRCDGFGVEVPVTREQLAQLGWVALDELTALDSPVDARLAWHRDDRGQVHAKGGYDRTTSIQMTTKVVGYRHVMPDPALCEGSTCSCPESEMCPPWWRQEIKPLECEHVLVDLESELETGDGAVSGTVRETMSIRRESHGDTTFVTGSSSLANAYGTLAIEHEGVSLGGGYLVVRRGVGAEGMFGAIAPVYLYGKLGSDAGVDSYQAIAPIWGTFEVGKPPESNWWSTEFYYF